MNTAKKAAAQKAVESVQPGMTVGFGTGTTAHWAIQEVGRLVLQGLKIKAVASSIASEEEAKKAGIQIVSFKNINSIDLYIDGADEVDEEKNLIKGGGGALLREKILAFNSNQFIVIVDESKVVKQLGKFRLPVEIIPFAASLTINNIAKLNCIPELRVRHNKAFVTDNGNWILDCDFGAINNSIELNHQLHAIPGVVETGLFFHTMIHQVIIGSASGSTRTL
ncbi:MAG: ribose-5-phosphate isomerase RpiA [Bacteroidota bacterium]|nr:ribose-5-phosphate isomerase RpiA [Bacteroidota bacterium]